MTEHDLLEVTEIEETCGLSLWGWRNYHAELARPEAIAFVAEINSKVNSTRASDARRVQGFIIARVVVDELQINNVAVRIEARGRGTGSELLRAALTEGRSRGARRAVLEVRQSNHAAHRLYAKHGFVVCGRRKNYYREPTEDALLFCAQW